MSRPGLISVHTSVVKEVMVDRIAERAREHAGQGATAERLGYAMRVVEAELFEPARHPADWIGAELRERMGHGSTPAEAAAGLSAELADAEPAEKPRPDDERAASWRVPGPGGHVRHFVAARLGAKPKRDFLLGFFSRCCEEALETGPDGGRAAAGPSPPPGRSPAGGGSNPPRG